MLSMYGATKNLRSSFVVSLLITIFLLEGWSWTTITKMIKGVSIEIEKTFEVCQRCDDNYEQMGVCLQQFNLHCDEYY